MPPPSAVAKLQATCAAALSTFSGDLYGARQAALALAQNHDRPPPAHTFRHSIAAGSFASATDDAAMGSAPQLHRDTESSCAAAWKEHVDRLLSRPDALQLVHAAHRRRAYTRAEQPTLVTTAPCFGEIGISPTAWAAEWEGCCSSLHSLRPHCPRGLSSAACCSLGNRSLTYLRLPALREIEVSVRLPSDRLVRVAQDGWLRPFDTSTTLWPAGYLLAQWAGHPHSPTCARSSRGIGSGRGGAGAGVGAGAGGGEAGRRVRVLELGAGVGLASTAAALCGAEVTASDAASRALALAVGNAALAGARIEAKVIDWEDDTHIAAAAELGPWDVIMGSALQFERWEGRLWRILETLTEPPEATAAARGAAAFETVVALAHTAGSLGSPPSGGGFAELGRLPGTAFGVHTAWEDSASDFELVLLRRRN